MSIATQMRFKRDRATKPLPEVQPRTHGALSQNQRADPRWASPPYWTATKLPRSADSSLTVH
jgi:hypothetical protein